MTNRIGVYELGKTLGEGNFGKVKFAINSETGEKFAVKILDKQKLVKNGMTNQIQKEIGILKMIRHRHIVNLKDVLVSKTKIFMILEYVPGGELFYKLAKEGRFDENLGRNYFQQLIAGVEYCHSRNICHRDLKPENLLVDDGNVLKISDFGLSALHSSEGNDANGSSKLLNTTCGTPNYIAPEVLSMNGYQGQPADLWSCGVILYVFLAGFLPFEDEKTEGLFKKIQKAQFKYPPWFSQGVKDLLNRILVVDPKKRYTIDRIKNHPWFKIGLEQNRNLRFGEENEGEGVRLGTSSSPPPRLLDLEDEKENNDLPTVNGIKITNAFDLISMSGAFDLTPMLVSPKKPSPISSGSVPSSSSSNPLNKVPSLTRLPTLNTPDNSTPLNLGLNNVTSVPRRNSDAIKRYPILFRGGPGPHLGETARRPRFDSLRPLRTDKKVQGASECALSDRSDHFHDRSLRSSSQPLHGRLFEEEG
eukprot:TRINITY_DN10653_c0_g2_i2.p1 TRINITY_DN10653_c0_g2~~TRINITY_DN10653_c0_g2_i2.p1  ORF type:complete len:475 (+),score=79.18 TRINITY_DN10653_c0_g2_i2:36-1460(+)